MPRLRMLSAGAGLGAVLAALPHAPLPPAEDGLRPAIAVVRLVALGTGWYLLLVAVAGLLLRACRAARLVRWLDVITLPGVRRMLDGAAGLALTVATLAPTAALA